MIYDDDIQDKLREIDEHIKKEYIESHPKEERDWRTYEQQFSKRIKEAMASLDPLIHESRNVIKIGKTVCINPGSEYAEGILRAVLVNLDDDGYKSYQFVSG